MPAYGFNPYPRRFGGGTGALRDELQALLDALEPGWDPGDETESYAELYAHALAIAIVWAVNGRVRAQAIPATMLEALPSWEEILRVPPTLSDQVQVRRGRVAAKLLGIASNAVAAITAVAQTICGLSYVELRTPSGAEVWSYWPGVNPGPPGLEWSSNLATVSIVVQQSTKTEAEYFAMIEQLTTTLMPMIPTWMTFCIGEDDGSGFVCSVGTLGLTVLGV